MVPSWLWLIFGPYRRVVLPCCHAIMRRGGVRLGRVENDLSARAQPIGTDEDADIQASLPHSTDGRGGICLERGCCGLGCGDFAGIPLFVFLDGNDADFGLHVVMAGAAELAAGELKIGRAGGGELHPLDGAARDGVLVKAEGRDVEGVDHVAGTEEDMNGFTDGNDQLGGGKVILASGIGGIDAEFVF